jgi:hypothetical protein
MIGIGIAATIEWETVLKFYNIQMKEINFLEKNGINEKIYYKRRINSW